ELSEKDQGWVDLVKEYTNEFGDVIEVRLITELLIQKDVEHKAEICKLEKENAKLKEWQRGVYSLSAYLVFHEKNNDVYMEQAKKELAQRDKQVKIDTLNDIKGYLYEGSIFIAVIDTKINQIKEEK
ncbi:MAG: hypothetical protein K0U08_03995, partial [Proteobacteria bacterium]|nr:hypothetical protein [Pseudomonadota bacterium]